MVKNELNNVDRVVFRRSAFRFLRNIVYNITSLELLTGDCAIQRRGVYMFVSIDYYNQEVNLEYIGMSVNVQNRVWQGKHEALDLLMESEADSKTIEIYYIDTNKYKDAEKLLIQSLRPRMNHQFNLEKKI